jgi:peptide/nickel transport system permease protein
MRRHPLVVVPLRRLLMAVPLLFVVSALSFVLVSLTPGDAARQILGINASPEEYAKVRHQLRLDQPLYDQYWHWLSHAVRGDLGASFISGESVTQIIKSGLPVTISLILLAVIVVSVIGVALGVLSAVRGGATGRSVDAFSMFGFSLPTFWLGLILIVLFAVKLQWFPAIGYVPFTQSPGEWLHSLTLPVLALAIGGIAGVARQTREAMLDALGSEYIRMARANGVPARSLYFRHALKNASIPVVTQLGLLTVGLLGGTVLVENVFAMQGLGRLVVGATSQHDLPVVQGIAIAFTLIVVVVNLVVDLAYAWLNPRVRT